MCQNIPFYIHFLVSMFYFIKKGQIVEGSEPSVESLEWP